MKNLNSLLFVSVLSYVEDVFLHKEDSREKITADGYLKNLKRKSETGKDCAQFQNQRIPSCEVFVVDYPQSDFDQNLDLKNEIDREKSKYPFLQNDWRHCDAFKKQNKIKPQTNRQHKL